MIRFFQFRQTLILFLMIASLPLACRGKKDSTSSGSSQNAATLTTGTLGAVSEATKTTAAAKTASVGTASVGPSATTTASTNPALAVPRVPAPAPAPCTGLRVGTNCYANQAAIQTLGDCITSGGVFVPAQSGGAGQCLGTLSQIKDQVSCVSAQLSTSPAATKPIFAAGSGTCYANFAAITTQADCIDPSLGAYFLGQSAPAGSVLCYSSVNALPQDVCTSMSLVWNADSGKCYANLEQIAAQKECLDSGGIWAPGTGGVSCLKNLTETTAQAQCTGALPTAGIWVPSLNQCVTDLSALSNQTDCRSGGGFWTGSLCVASLSAIGSSSECVVASGHFDSFDTTTNICYPSIDLIPDRAGCLANKGWWINNPSPAHCISYYAITPSLCVGENACAVNSASNFVVLQNACPSGWNWSFAKNKCALLCPPTNTCVPYFTGLVYPLTDQNGNSYSTWGPAQDTFSADMDGDGSPDIVSVIPSSGVLVVVFNQQGGQGPLVKQYSFPANQWGDNYDVSNVDFLNYGRGMVTSYSRVNRQLYVYFLVPNDRSQPLSIANSKLAWNIVSTNNQTSSIAVEAPWSWFGNWDGNGPGLMSSVFGLLFMTLKPPPSVLEYGTPVWVMAPGLDLKNFTNPPPGFTSWSQLFNKTHPEWTWAANFYGTAQTQLVMLGYDTNVDAGTLNVFNYQNKKDANNNYYPTLTSCFGGNWGTADFTWVADFTGHGDGHLDILSRGGTTLFFKKMNATSGCFDLQRYDMSSNWGDNNLTYVGEFNGTGKAGILTFLNAGSQYVFRYQGSGKFSASTFFETNPQNTPPGITVVGQFLPDKTREYSSAVYVPQFPLGFSQSIDWFGNGLTDIVTISGSNLYILQTNFIAR